MCLSVWCLSLCLSGGRNENLDSETQCHMFYTHIIPLSHVCRGLRFSRSSSPRLPSRHFWARFHQSMQDLRFSRIPFFFSLPPRVLDEVQFNSSCRFFLFSFNWRRRSLVMRWCAASRHSGAPRWLLDDHAAGQVLGVVLEELGRGSRTVGQLQLLQVLQLDEAWEAVGGQQRAP